MSAQPVVEIEREFARLTTDDQLRLLERLVRHVRGDSGKRKWEDDLAAMAKDPQIKREIALINSEFEVAEADGLDRE